MNITFMDVYFFIVEVKITSRKLVGQMGYLRIFEDGGTMVERYLRMVDRWWIGISCSDPFCVSF